MKNLSNKIIGSIMVMFIFLFIWSMDVDVKKFLHSNINLSYISYLYNGDLLYFKKDKTVAKDNYIYVKEYQIVDNSINVTTFGENVSSPIEGTVIRKGTNDGIHYLIIETKNGRYQIDGLSSVKVALYEYINYNKKIGFTKGHEYKLTDLEKQEFKDVANFITDYEEA